MGTADGHTGPFPRASLGQPAPGRQLGSAASPLGRESAWPAKQHAAQGSPGQAPAQGGIVAGKGEGHGGHGHPDGHGGSAVTHPLQNAAGHAADAMASSHASQTHGGTCWATRGTCWATVGHRIDSGHRSVSGVAEATAACFRTAGCQIPAGHAEWRTADGVADSR